MKKVLLCLSILLLLGSTSPLIAAPYLLGMQINEDLVVGKTDLYLTASGLFSDGSRQQITEGLRWQTSNRSIAEISENGRLHFTGSGGPVTITVFKEGISSSKTVTVNPWPETLEIETTLLYSENPTRLAAKGRFSDGVTRYYNPEDGLQWFSDNVWVAWVNRQGVVTFTGENGTVTIRAASGALSASVTCRVDRGEEGQTTTYRTGIRIKEEIKYSKDPVQLTLVAILSNQQEETIDHSAADWWSSNTAVVSFNGEDELVFSGKAGFANIKVSYGGYHYETLVTVERFIESLVINETLNFTPAWEGLPLQLSASVRYNDGSQYNRSTGLTWVVDNTKVATISAEGVLVFSGEPGLLNVTVSGVGVGGTMIENIVPTEVKAYVKASPQRIFSDTHPLGVEALSPKVFCVYNDGAVKEVTQQVTWRSLSPQATIYQGKIYFPCLFGPVRVVATYQGVAQELKGYNFPTSTSASRIQQVRIKESGVAYSFLPQKLTALAVTGNGQVKEVTSSLTWRSSQPLVAKVNKGVLTFTGRTGKTTISAQGYGFRDELIVEITPAELQPRVEKLIIEGTLTQAANSLKVRAYYNNGEAKDVTQEVVWNSTNKNVAVVSSDGTVMFPQGMMPVTIWAHYLNMGASLSREEAQEQANLNK